MRKALVIIASVIIIGTSALLIYTSFKKINVTFSLKGGGYTVQIRNLKGTLIKEIGSSQDIPLKKGDYFYNIEGEGYDTKSIYFTVSMSSRSVTVLPQYLDSYLSKLQTNEKSAIISTLKREYPAIANLSIINLNINNTNTWAYGTLTADSSGDIYRFVMKRNDKTWEIAAKPSIALSIKDNPTIPKEILYSLY